MRYSKSFQKLSRTAWFAAQKVRLRYTILRAAMRGNTSEKTCACCAADATGKFITYPVRRVCRKDKCSTLKDYAIRFSGRPERWPAAAVVIVWLMVVSIFLAGHLIGEGIVYLLWRNQ